MKFTPFPHCKKNYPFYPFLIPKFILFSLFERGFCLKVGQGLNLSKDRKRIKTSYHREVIVGLVNPTYKLKYTFFPKKYFLTFKTLSTSYFIGKPSPNHLVKKLLAFFAIFFVALTIDKLLNELLTLDIVPSILFTVFTILPFLSK